LGANSLIVVVVCIKPKLIMMRIYHTVFSGFNVNTSYVTKLLIKFITQIINLFSFLNNRKGCGGSLSLREAEVRI